jgi:peptidyl-prolyl cis-trans isomerase C
MKFVTIGALFCALAAYGQTPAPSGAAKLANLPQDAVYATVNGKKITVAQMQRILQRVRQPGANEKELLRQYELMLRLSADAEKDKLDQKSPWKDDLEWSRAQLLATAQINTFFNNVAVPVDEQQKFYETNRNRFEHAKVKLIYLPFSANTESSDPKKKPMTEQQALAKAEAVLKQARGGADFVKLVKENSADSTSAGKDGDFGAPIRRSDALPEPVKTAIFSLKPGEISEPVRQANGFYLFRLEEIGVQSFEQAKDEIANELKQLRLRDYMDKTSKTIEVQIENVAPVTASTPPAGATVVSK